MNDPNVLSDEVIREEFCIMVGIDRGVHDEARLAYHEMVSVPYDHLDRPAQTLLDSSPQAGVVGRRGPFNPFASSKAGAYIEDAEENEAKKRMKDPALRNNPLRGRLLVTIGSTAVLFFVFSQCLIYNKLVNGEYYSQGLGPTSQVLYDFGGLNTNQIRKGEKVRLFWSMCMHSTWLHILFNLVIQLQFLYMIEPDWGLSRTLLLFFVAGLSGNLMSSVADPCTTTVGSSGALFGLMGALVPYCVEYWKTLSRPVVMLVVVLGVLIVSVGTGFTKGSDNWAHMGGVIGGLCFGFATITSIETCYGCCPCSQYTGPSKSRNNIVVEEGGMTKLKMVRPSNLAKVPKKLAPRCRCGWREWLVRGINWAVIFIMWFVCFWLLLVAYDYEAPGHVTFSGVRACCCDYVPGEPEVMENWVCAFCDLTPSKSASLAAWEEGPFRAVASAPVVANMTWGNLIEAPWEVYQQYKGFSPPLFDP